MNIETQNIFFTSDYHIGHNNILRLDNRPFKNINEMHETLIENWNSVVNDDSIVFYLGDYVYKGSNKLAKWFSSQLKGKIHFIMGNHDKYNNIVNLNRFEKIYGDNTSLGGCTIYVKDEHVGWQTIVMSHYAILSWNKAHRGSWHLHGHSHQGLFNNTNMKWFYDKKVIDVGCNGWNYKPLSYKEIKDIMSKKINIKVDSEM
jgi:calcineurin-like phosphoesterase family protein